jgi:hypothetical protein
MADPSRHRATVAIYDRPPWWRTRKALRLALPIVAALVSLAIWYAVLA